MSHKKAFVNAENKARITCPECGKVFMIDASQYIGNERAVRFKAKCPCGNPFGVLLERRQLFRKGTKLMGEVYLRNAPRRKNVVEILDISQNGLKLTLPPDINLKVDDRIVVEFQLDDAQKSAIKKTVIVRNIIVTSVTGGLAGCEFTQASQYDQVAKYLMFN